MSIEFQAILDQQKKVDTLKRAFDCESNADFNLSIKYDILIMMLQESAKLDRMEDAYLRRDKALDRIEETIYAE
jgi:hypothetical protein